MEDKFKLYEEILKKYSCSNYGTFLQTDDINFDFEAESIFIKKGDDGYTLFIEDDGALYLFCLNFENYNIDKNSDHYVNIKNNNGRIHFYSDQGDYSEILIKANKFNFLKDDIMYIIKQIKSEKLFLLLLEQKNNIKKGENFYGW